MLTFLSNVANKTINKSLTRIFALQAQGIAG